MLHQMWGIFLKSFLIHTANISWLSERFTVSRVKPRVGRSSYPYPYLSPITRHTQATLAPFQTKSLLGDRLYPHLPPLSSSP